MKKIEKEKKIELLAPAGNMEKLKVAIAYGADAVYLGGKAFGLRAFGGNFSDEEILQAVAYAHERQCKVYVTVNIFPHNDDITNLPQYLHFLAKAEIDAVIVSDLGVYRMIKEEKLNLPIHVSTQANVVNWQAALQWQEMGAERVVLGREVALNDIKLISQKTSMIIETFVHGAMCISYSGRCLLSNYFNMRDANKGACTHPCRWKYFVSEETRPGEFQPIAEDEYGTYIFNSKDLCLLSEMPQLINAGIKSFKIEGRMKSVHYIATIVKAYRKALDWCLDSTADDMAAYKVDDDQTAELQKISHRPYTTGFYFNKPTEEDQVYSGSSNIQTHDFVGIVRSYDRENKMAIVEQRNNIKKGELLEFFSPSLPTFSQEISYMADENGIEIETAPHAQQLIRIAVSQPVEVYSLLRRRCLDV